MAFSDTRIHQIELLLTLDYLLRFTDENHPATQIDICRYANDFGLKYDSKAKSGNDVRRQRIGDCLKFLMEVTSKFPEEAPFILQQNDSGKYYIESKNYLSEDQVIKILAAVKNDRYTQDEDTSLLIERLLDSLSNVHNRGYFIDELDKLNKGVRKYSPAVNRKIRLVTKAYTEGKMIKIRIIIYDGPKPITYYFWYRVYSIKEFRNTPYAILIPISTGSIVFFRNYIFDTIENLDIPSGPDKDVLLDDLDSNRDLDQLFMQRTRLARRRYNSPSSLLRETMMPVSGIACKVGFYFNGAFAHQVKSSFEEMFSTKLECVPCASFNIIDTKGIDPKTNEKDYIIPDPLKEGESKRYYVANIFIDQMAFMSWLTSKAYNTGGADISNMVIVVAPQFINDYLYRYYMDHAKKIRNLVSEEFANKIDKDSDKFLHMPYIHK